MAPSARRASLWLVFALALVATGCEVTTTQEKDDRLTVKAERTLVRPKEIKVDEPAPNVEVGRTSVVHEEKASAIAVELENRGDEIVNDLPIAVGIKGAKGDGYVNLEGGIRYFQSHIPALAPGEKATWVFSTKKDVPEGEPFAKVGAPADPPLTTADDLPDIEATRTVAATKGEATIEVDVRNASDIPQYEVEIYASAEHHGKVIAAGSASIAELDAGMSESVKVALVGDPGDAAVDVFVPPTIFK